MRYGKAWMSGTNDSIIKVCIGDGFWFFYKNGIHVKDTDRSIQQSKMVSNFLQMDVKVYRLSRIPLIIPFEGYKTMACV